MKTDTFFAFIGGAIVGAAAALLLAPESGEQTRKKIRESIDTEYQALKKKYEDFKAKNDIDDTQAQPEESQA
ncbi:MAG: YtxH domain-containing protein [Alistipes sp.]|nr:YtxH domain-containing protein [Candidatus Minthomonas equi]